MAYLSPDQIRATSLNDAAPLSMFISHDFGTTTFLVGSGVDPDVIVLESLNAPDDMAAGTAWARTQTSNWSGVEFTDILVEVDETSALPPAGGYPVFSVIRGETDLAVVTRSANVGGRRSHSLIAEGLPKGKAGSSVAFSRWRLVRKDSDGKTALVWPVDATKPNRTPAG